MKTENGKPYVSVVVPTFKERRNIRHLINAIGDSLRGLSYEIIVVDKHSPDGTPDIARSMGARVLYEDKGKGNALRMGFAAARGRIIISMDADMSHRPNELKLLIAGIEAGYDLCMGSRFLVGGGTEDMPLFRKFGNKVFVTLVNLMYGAHYSDLCYGYRSMTPEAVRKLHLNSVGFGIETEINIKAKKVGLRVLEVPSYEKRRNFGKGKLSSFRDGYVILKTIFGNLR
ncbi:MAG: glycosyltransferase family 2 protein [Candidatus Marsarchaeota archaeon]|nr:glycosyltransferase family 2 protein [Candidatus Marsarchaeota archaeon]